MREIVNIMPPSILFCSAAPSAPPTSVTAATVTPTTIAVQWGEVDCIHRNGEITGYSVKHSGGGSPNTVSGGDTRQTTIPGLTPSTEYTIQVAAMNNVDSGPYSTGIVRETTGEV